MFRSIKTVERFSQPAVNQDAGAAAVDATAIPLDFSAVSTIGTPTETGDALIVATGIDSTAAIGTADAGVITIASPSGVSSSSAIGSAAPSGAGNVTPAGLTSASAIGSAIAGVSGTTAPVGVSSLSAVGTATETATALVVPAGLQTASAIGTASSGAPADIVNNAGGGRVLRPYRVPDAAFVEGIASVSRIGQVTARGTARTQPRGLASRSALGTVTAGVVVPLVPSHSTSGIGDVRAVAVYRHAVLPYQPAARPAIARGVVPETHARLGYARAAVAVATPDDLDLLALLDEVAA